MVLAAFLLGTLWAPGVVYAADSAASANDLSLEKAIDMASKIDPTALKTNYDEDSARIQRNNAFDNVTYMPMGGMVTPAYSGKVNDYESAQLSYDLAKKNKEMQKDSLASRVIATYTGLLTYRNSLEQTKAELEQLEKRYAIAKTSLSLGMMSQSDFNELETRLNQARESLKALEASCQAQEVALNEMIGQNRNTTINLTSKPALEKVVRTDLDTEINRALTESTAVLSAETSYKIAKNKEKWYIAGVTAEQTQISISQADLAYRKAKQDMANSISGLLSKIDAKEREIVSNKEAYKLAQSNLAIAETKYKVGSIPYATAAGTGDLLSYRVALLKARIALESSLIALIGYKDDLYLNTGRTVYDAKDWQAVTPEVKTASATVLDMSKPQNSTRIVFTMDKKSYIAGDTTKALEVAPYAKQGKTYLPVRALGEALGAMTVYNSQDKTITLTKGTNKVVLTMNDPYITVNGQKNRMEVKPEVVAGRTMLPARYVVEGLGGLLNWNEKTKEIVIFK